MRSDLSFDQLQQHAARLAEVTGIIEIKEMRWLELSEELT